MSLYDKYHSQHNKSYMYDLIINLINKDNTINPSNNSQYNQFFETNFKNTFQVIDTEELTVLNKHLLETQIDYYDRFIKNKTIINSDKTDKIESLHTISDNSMSNNTISDTTYENSNENVENITIHSLNRNINLKNSSRFNYRIKNYMKGKPFQIDRLIIPIENTHVFMNPILIISIDTHYCELYLRGKIELRDRSYGIYTPFNESMITINSEIIRIQIKNQLYNVNKGCDIYKIISSQSDKIILSTTENEFKIGDFIKLYNFDKIEIDNKLLNTQYTIKSIYKLDDTIEIKLNKKLDNLNGLYIMNLSLQNTLNVIV